MKTVIQTAAKTHLYGMNILAFTSFFHHPLRHFQNVLLTFKLVDVLVCIFGAIKIGSR